MTAIPATLASANEADAVQITLDGLSNHTLSRNETRDDILLFFDIELTTEQALQMSGYLGRVLSMVRGGDMRAVDAAGEIREVMQAFRSDQYELNLG